MEFHWKFQRGGGFLSDNPSVERVWILIFMELIHEGGYGYVMELYVTNMCL